MIASEIRGKHGDEDRLTSMAFGLLRYLPFDTGIRLLLRRVRPFSGITFPDLCEAVRVEVEFWHRHATYGEPDVILRLFDAAGRVRWVLLVEVKLHSAKSGRATGEEELDTDHPDPDQLVKYWQLLRGLDDVKAGATPYLVYLTKHATPPEEELNESLRRQPTMALGWLSWRDVWAVARQTESTSVPAADLARLLAHLGLKQFDGFTPRVWATPDRTTFWHRRGWFHQRKHWTPPRVRSFWEAQA